MPRYTFGVTVSSIVITPEPAGPSRELLRSTPFLLKRLGAAAKERSLEAFESTKLNPQHYAVLSLLEEGTRETQATVADALGYDRSHLVSLTPAGKTTLGRLRAISKQVEKDFLAPLGPE